jgi:hypothetical protein
MDTWSKQTWNSPDWPNVIPADLRFGGALAMLVRKMERRRLWTADRVP